MTDILVIGESVADVIGQADGSTVTHAGGSPANVAFGLARLGVDTAFLTQLGSDADGALIRDHLIGAGVRVIEGEPVPSHTPRATAHIAPDGSATYEFAIDWTLDTATDQPGAPTIPTAPHLHTGSIAAFLAPGADAVLTLLAEARSGTSISVDPNIRPALMPDHAAAVARFERLAAIADVVKASDEDLAWLYPETTDAGAAAHLVRLGAGLVVVTRGADGAYALTADREVQVPAVRTAVVDTVGAGDSFMSALLASLHGAGLLGRAGAMTDPLSAAALEQHVTTAVRAAAITVSRAGALPPTTAELG